MMNVRVLWLGALNLLTLAVGLPLTWRTGDTGAVYPSRPIELVVPFTQGGGSDAFARVIKKAVEDNRLLPVPLVIINRGGAGATVGSRYVKNARPDGYTMLVLHDAILTAKSSGMVDYGAEAFEAIAGTGEMGMVIAVHENSPFRTLSELLEHARAAPQTLRFGANRGAPTHFAGLQLEQVSPGSRFLYPQVGGGAERFADLIGGHMDVTGFSIEEFHRFAPGGLRGLAYLGEERHPAAAELPTARELGLDVINTNMYFWWCPKGTPAARLAVLRRMLRQAMETSYVRQKLDEIQCEPVFLTGASLNDRLRDSEQRFSSMFARPPAVMVDLPWALLGGVLVCSVGLLIDATRRHWPRTANPVGAVARTAEQDSPMPAVSPAGRHRGVLCLLLTAAYLGGMMLGVGFPVATIVFVPAVALLIEPAMRGPKLLLTLLLGQGLGFGVDLLFSRVLDVTLP
jgi:tripartite-type tricarboxylate transporter receptor subunit TctC